jgi:NitT/TauT family transport system substrate-binding protein
MKRAWLIAIVALLTVVGGIYLYVSSKPVPQQGPTAVRVAQTGDFLIYSSLYLAQDTGAFARNGLQVSITNTGGDENSVAAVLSGRAEFGVGDPTFAAIARERGQDIRVVASIVNGVPFWGITYDPAVVQSYGRTGLRGLTVATFPAPSTAYTLQRDMFERAGVTPSIREGAFGSLAGILERRQAQVALELEPNVSQAQARGATVLYSMAQRYGDFAITGVTVQGAYAAAHRDVVVAFNRSLNEADNFARQHPREAVELLAGRFPELPREVIANAMTRMTGDNVIPRSSVIAPDAWRRAVELRARAGDIRNVSLALSALDNSYAEQASR